MDALRDAVGAALRSSRATEELRCAVRVTTVGLLFQVKAAKAAANAFVMDFSAGIQVKYFKRLFAYTRKILWDCRPAAASGREKEND